MTRNRIMKLASVVLVVLGAATAVQAGEGGGGGGMGGGGNDRLKEAEERFARANNRFGLNVRTFGHYGEAVLPDGTRIRSTGLFNGDRLVTTVTPDGQATAGIRPKGQKANAEGASSRTVYNPRTGITSTFTRYADGSTIGIHVDAQGNRSTSTSMKP